MALLMAGVVVAPNPAAEQAVGFDFEDGKLDGWRCKANATMRIVTAEGRGKVLEGRIEYGEFKFGWFTRQFPEADFSGIWAVEVEVRGDGQGGKLDCQLGRRAKDRPVYYRDSRDGVALDFTGWRKVSFLLPRFDTPKGGNRAEDLQQIHFVELFIDGGRDQGATQVAFDNLRCVPATVEQKVLLERQQADARKLAGPPATDGSNLLPNPDFELDLAESGRPEFWNPGDWGLGSVLRYESERRHGGARSVSVECAAATQRGSWDCRVPLTPGHWKFSAWYAAEGLKADKHKGVDARITLGDKDNQTLTAAHAYGEDSRGEWRPIAVEFEAPPGTAYATVYLFNFFAPGKVWWDDVHLGADVKKLAAAEARRRANEVALREATAMVDPARQAVAELAARPGDKNDDRKLLEAVLTWAVQDAELSLKAGLGEAAQAVLTDVQDMCRRADEILAKAGGGVHPPPVQPDLDANPYYATLNRQLPGLASDTTVYQKGAEGYRQIANAWTFRTLGEHSLVLAWGLLHPRSARYHDPLLLTRMLTLFQAICQNHRGGDFNPDREAVFGRDPNINRFCLSPMMDALLRLEAEYPWAIPPSKREEWRRELRTLVDYQYQTYGPREPLEPERPRYYPNMDVHHLLIMEWAHRLFGDDRYAADRDTMLQWLDDALYPDGGWTYHWPQNECYVYHQLNVTFIARYLEATGDQRARAILRKSAGYYPLVHDGEGMTESWSDCSWKHYWTAAAPAGADVIAGMFDDPANKRAALDAGQDAYDGGQSAIYTGPWWKDLKPADRPDKVLVYDRSVQGPRGQYGVFSFGGTGRVTAVGEIGKDTFVGCLIADRKEKPLPLDSALQVATVEARLKPDGGHWQNARYCSGRERFSQIVTPDFATLCVRYRITRPAWGHGSTDEPFEGVQQWLLCQDRLIGRLTIRALEDTQCAGLWGRLRFGLRKEIEAGENGWYKYGGLLAKVHAHDFARVETAPSETFFLDKPEGYRSREILLKDDQAVSGAAPPYAYRRGHERYFLTEVLPYWSEPATEVSQIHDGAVLGFSFRAGGKRYMVLHNEGETAVKHAVKPAGAKGVVWSPGGAQGVMANWSGGEVAIPAGEQVVVVSP